MTISIRREIDAASAPVAEFVGREIDASIIARDSLLEERSGVYTAMIAQIPAIKLGRTSYRVVSGGRCGLELVGPRGGASTLVPNEKNPTLWAHLTIAGLKARTTWYRREDDGTFTAI